MIEINYKVFLGKYIFCVCVHVGALSIERPTDVEEGYALTAPLVYHFGHKSPADNLQLYNLLIMRVAEILNLRCESNTKGQCTNMLNGPILGQLRYYNMVQSGVRPIAHSSVNMGMFRNQNSE